MKIRVLHVIQDLHIGGAEKSLLDICKTYNQELFEFSVITFWHGDKLEYEFVNSTVNIRYVCLNCKNRYDVSIYPKLLKYIKHYNPQIVHTHLPIAGIYSRLCKPFTKSLYITTQHSVVYKRNFFHFFNRITSRIFNDWYIANSEFTKKFLIKHKYSRKERTELIYLGVDFKSFEKKSTGISCQQLKQTFDIPEKAKVIGYIASFKKERGHVEFLEIIRKCIAVKPDLYFVLVGDGTMRESVIQLASQMNIDSNIVFPGNVTNTSDYLRLMDIFVLPTFYESFGISIIEAMYMNVPVIAYDTCAVSEIVGSDRGILVTAFDKHAFSKILLEIVETPLKTSKYTENAYNFVTTQFTIRKMVDELEKFYIRITNL